MRSLLLFVGAFLTGWAARVHQPTATSATRGWSARPSGSPAARRQWLPCCNIIKAKKIAFIRREAEEARQERAERRRRRQPSGKSLARLEWTIGGHVAIARMVITRICQAWPLFAIIGFIGYITIFTSTAMDGLGFFEPSANGSMQTAERLWYHGTIVTIIQTLYFAHVTALLKGRFGLKSYRLMFERDFQLAPGKKLFPAVVLPWVWFGLSQWAIFSFIPGSADDQFFVYVGLVLNGLAFFIDGKFNNFTATRYLWPSKQVSPASLSESSP